MATSPIFGWEEPDDTDLVKDGASAIRTLGNAIDTTMGTMVAKTIIDAKGDLIAGTAADTAARLAVGSNGQVLKADSTTSTGLAWGAVVAGGLTLISTTAMPTSASSVEITSIPTTYNQLIFRFVNCYQSGNGAAGNPNYFQLNGDTGSNYVSQLNYNYGWGGSNPSNNWYQIVSATNDLRCFMMSGTTSSYYEINIYRANESVEHYFQSSGGNSVTGISYGTGVHTATSAAVSSFKFYSTNGNFGGGSILLYGVTY